MNQVPEKIKAKMIKRMRREIFLGFLVGLFATFCGMFLYVQYFSQYDFETTLALIKRGNMYAQVLALSALPNLFVFFVFIKKKQDYRARGVLIATMLTALITFVLKLV